MHDFLSPDLEKDEKGNLDVAAELRSIDKFKEIGMDIEGMEQLLFTDIDSYKKRKMVLIRKHLLSMDGSDQNIPITTFNEDKTSQKDNMADSFLIGKPLSELMKEEEEQSAFRSNEKEDIDLKDKTTIDREKSLSHEGESVRGPERGSLLVSGAVKKPEEQKESKRISGKKPNKYRKFIPLIASVLIIIILVSTAYFIWMVAQDRDGTGVTELSADFLISDANPVSGSKVFFDAKFKETGSEHTWTIFPEDFSILNDTGGKGRTELYFKKGGTYRIDLLVKYGGKSISSFQVLEVKDREITIARERYGDSSTYDVSGNIFISNIKNVIHAKDVLSYDILSSEYRTVPGKPLETKVLEGTYKAKDGLGSEYSHLKRSSNQELEFVGYLEKRNGFRSTLTGRSYISQETMIDIFKKRPTSSHSSVSSAFTFQAIAGTTVEYSGNEDLWIYPSLTYDLKELKVEDISDGRNIKAGDMGVTRWGSNDLEWEAKNIELVRERPALNITFSLPSRSMQKLDLRAFSMVFYLAEGIPVSVRTQVNIESTDDVQSPYILNHIQELVSFLPGSSPIVYGAFDTAHENLTRIDQVHPEMARELHDNWTYAPLLGGYQCTIPKDFDAQDAISKFENTLTFKVFKQESDDLYSLYSNYSKFLGSEQWRFSIGEKDEQSCWNQTVRRDNIDQGGRSRIDPASFSREELGVVLTYSGAEMSLKMLLPILGKDYAVRSYGVETPGESSDLDTEQTSIGTRVDHPYPSIGLVNPGIIERIPMCLRIESFDGSMEIGLDMQTGQLSYLRSTEVRKTG